MCVREQIKEKYQNGCHLKTVSWNNRQKGNDNILEAYLHIHVKDEVSMTTHMDRRACKRKVPKWLQFEN